jgi:hypothetical protein
MNKKIMEALDDTHRLLDALVPTQVETNVIIDDRDLVKKIINASWGLAVHGSNESIKKRGWEGLLNSGDMNANLLSLMSNRSIFLYTQLIIMVVIGLLSEDRNENKSPENTKS